MRVVPILALWLFSTAAAGAGDWTVFANDRFGFAIDVPAAYRPSAAPANDDGRAFTAPDGRSTIRAYGHLLEDGSGFAADERIEERYAEEDGVQVTYRQVSSRSTTFSGLKGDRILYQHAVPTCHAECRRDRLGGLSGRAESALRSHHRAAGPHASRFERLRRVRIFDRRR